MEQNQNKTTASRTKSTKKTKSSPSRNKSATKKKKKKTSSKKASSTNIKKDSNLYLKYDPESQSPKSSTANNSRKSTGSSKTSTSLDKTDVISWIKQNPGKSVALGLVGALSLKAQATRKLLFWTASTAGTMFFKNKVQEMIENSDDHQQKGRNISQDENLSTPSVH